MELVKALKMQKATKIAQMKYTNTETPQDGGDIEISKLQYILKSKKLLVLFQESINLNKY